MSEAAIWGANGEILTFFFFFLINSSLILCSVCTVDRAPHSVSGLQPVVLLQQRGNRRAGRAGSVGGEVYTGYLCLRDF